MHVNRTAPAAQPWGDETFTHSVARTLGTAADAAVPRECFRDMIGEEIGGMMGGSLGGPLAAAVGGIGGAIGGRIACSPGPPHAAAPDEGLRADPGVFDATSIGGSAPGEHW